MPIEFYLYVYFQGWPFGIVQTIDVLFPKMLPCEGDTGISLSLGEPSSPENWEMDLEDQVPPEANDSRASSKNKKEIQRVPYVWVHSMVYLEIILL